MGAAIFLCCIKLQCFQRIVNLKKVIILFARWRHIKSTPNSLTEQCDSNLVTMFTKKSSEDSLINYN